MYFKMKPNIFHLTIYYKFFIILFIATSYSSNAQQKQFIPPNTQNPFKVKRLNSNPNSILMPKLSVKKNNQKKSKKIKTNKGSFMLNFEDANVTLSKTVNTKETHQKLALKFNEWFDLKKEHSFQLVSEKTDNYNTTHYNYQQRYKCFKVYGGSVLLHYKNGDAYAVNGKIAEFDNLDTSIVLTEAQALNKAKAYKKVTELIKEYPIEKVIYKISSENEANYTLAYKVRIDAYQPFVMANVFVDAKTGGIINDITLIAHTDTTATANTFYSGVQTITTDLTNGVYTLKDNDRNIETYDGTLWELGVNEPVLYDNNSTTWGGLPIINGFFIDELSPNWWQQYSLIDSNPDIYIKIKDASGNIVFNSENNFVSNFLPTTANPLIIPLNIYFTNPPYTYEIWDYDLVGDDDFGGSGNLEINNGVNNWSIGNNNGKYLIDLSETNPALDVHWGMEVTYDYYLNTFGRDSYDGNGSVIVNIINPPYMQEGEKRNNASAGALGLPIMSFGLGDGINFNPFVGLDVEGHEYSHLVINNNGNGGLDYERESGALNESFADIFGTSIEFYSGVNTDWLIGEGIKINQEPLRSMSNPKDFNHPDTYNGENWKNPICGVPEREANDYCGVHTNSGVQNYWFYLLSEGGSGTNDIGNTYSVTGIGIDKAGEIAYKNLTTYLPSQTSDYYNSYLGSLQAAQEIYGISSQEYNSVRQAWYAVGIGNDPNEQCSGVTNLIAETGTFSDGSGNLGNYSDNANCKWVIAPTGATQITLNFTEFNTEADYDIVTVYDGPDDTFPILATWWGNTLPTAITTTDGVGAMCVKFTSDISDNFSGWSANYTATVVPASCGGLTTLTNGSDSFNDGSGIDNYINNQQCTWYIAPPCASSVTLSFTEFDTESNFDGVIVYDDLYGTNLLGAYTGNTIPSNITSNTGEMLVFFVSDYSTSLGGFNASYTSTGTSNYSLADTVLNTSDYGEISDGSSATDYCNNTSSSWLIQPPQATSITLDFTEFDLEESSSDGSAIYDYVTVYDGIDSSSPVLGKFSGSFLPPNLTSTNGSMFITFNSDTSNTFQGWKAFYTSIQAPICSNETLTAENGTLSDGSGLQDYSNNSECSWLIQPDNGNIITLTFTEFDTEEDFDGVLIYDGIDESSELIGVFTGSDIPEVISSTGGSMYVLFVSDESIRKEGWSANYDTNSLSIGQTNQLESIKVYPNPTSGIVYISPSEKVLTIQIYDLLGKVIMSEKGVNKVNIRDLSSGVYMIKLSDGDNESLHRIIKD